MDRLWKYLMQLDARALFFGSVVLFVLVVLLVAWLSFHHTSATPETPLKITAPASAHTAYRDIGVLGVVSNQMSADALIVPVNPFRPSIENMGANRFIGSVTNRVLARTAKVNRVEGLRLPSDNAPAIPTLTFRGYFQRPDGTSAALFHDSVDNANRFFTPTSKIREATLLAADIHTAKIQKPDGQTVELKIGDSVTLTATTP